jgi:hypothetical protein
MATPFSARGGLQVLARHDLGNDRGEDRPAHGEPDAVGEDEQEEDRRAHVAPGRSRGRPTAAFAATQNCVAMK